MSRGPEPESTPMWPGSQALHHYARLNFKITIRIYVYVYCSCVLLLTVLFLCILLCIFMYTIIYSSNSRPAFLGLSLHAKHYTWHCTHCMLFIIFPGVFPSGFQLYLHFRPQIREVQHTAQGHRARRL